MPLSFLSATGTGATQLPDRLEKDARDLVDAVSKNIFLEFGEERRSRAEKAVETILEGWPIRNSDLRKISAAIRRRGEDRNPFNNGCHLGSTLRSTAAAIDVFVAAAEAAHTIPVEGPTAGYVAVSTALDANANALASDTRAFLQAALRVKKAADRADRANHKDLREEMGFSDTHYRIFGPARLGTGPVDENAVRAWWIQQQSDPAAYRAELEDVASGIDLEIAKLGTDNMYSRERTREGIGGLEFHEGPLEQGADKKSLSQVLDGLLHIGTGFIVNERKHPGLSLPISANNYSIRGILFVDDKGWVAGVGYLSGQGPRTARDAEPAASIWVS